MHVSRRVFCLLFSFAVTSLITFSYGYVTNTKVKFVIVVESSNSSLRDNEIRTVSTENVVVVHHSVSFFLLSLSLRLCFSHLAILK